MSRSRHAVMAVLALLLLSGCGQNDYWGLTDSYPFRSPTPTPTPTCVVDKTSATPPEPTVNRRER